MRNLAENRFIALAMLAQRENSENTSLCIPYKKVIITLSHRNVNEIH